MSTPVVIILVSVVVLLAIALLVLLSTFWWNVEVGLFPGKNVRATTSPPGKARSEPALAVNPRNNQNMVGASKRFFDLDNYLFDLVPIFSFDGGQTWRESTLPIESGWDGMTDPTIAFDDEGRAFLVGEPLVYDPTATPPREILTGLGMFVFRSVDGGRTWQRLAQLSSDEKDDKQWVVCDTHRSSPHYGNIYGAWGNGKTPVKFSRSTDHGEHWQGVGQQPSGSPLTTEMVEAPDLSVSPDGTLHIFWHDRGVSESSIHYLRSSDGGSSFEPLRKIVTGLTSIGKPWLDEIHTWPHFIHATFRVRTFATSCAGAGGLVVVAWADMREGHVLDPVGLGHPERRLARVYYRRSLNYGATWEGPDSGQPLVALPSDERHCFHPQLQATGTGVVGCAFYSFAPESDGRYSISVQLTASRDDAASFRELATITDRPWDPAVKAPELDEVPGITFIGEYLGLDAGHDTLALLWTDTRTGFQELWSDVVETERISRRRFPELVGKIVTGVIQDGGGLVLVGGKLIRIPPHSPVFGAIEKLAAKVSAAKGKHE